LAFLSGSLFGQIRFTGRSFTTMTIKEAANFEPIPISFSGRSRGQCGHRLWRVGRGNCRGFAMVRALPKRRRFRQNQRDIYRYLIG